MPLTFSFDLEDHRLETSVPLRCQKPTELLLEWLAEREAKATVFIVGALARRCPPLLQAIAAAGHEIGLHGWDHRSIETTGEGQYLEELRRGIGDLEDITGAAVRLACASFLVDPKHPMGRSSLGPRWI